MELLHSPLEMRALVCRALSPGNLDWGCEQIAMSERAVFRDCPEKSGCFAKNGVPIALLVSEILPPYLIKRPSLNASVSLRMIEV